MNRRRRSINYQAILLQVIAPLCFAAVLCASNEDQVPRSARLQNLDVMIFNLVNKDPESVYDSAWVEVALSRAEGKVGLEAQAHYYLASIWNWRNNLDSALYHARLSRDLAVQHGGKGQMGTGYNILGIVFELRGQLDSALVAYNKSLECGLQGGGDRSVARAHLNLGMVYRTQGNYLKSLEHLHQAEEVCLCREYHHYLPNLYLTIGGVYQLLGEQELACENLHAAKRWAIRCQKPRTEAASMEGLGDNALAAGDTVEALCWYESSLEMARQAKIPGQVGQSSAKAAMMMLGLGRDEDAAHAAALAVQMAQSDHDTVNLSLAEYAAGEVDLATGHFASALRHCQAAYTHARRSRQTSTMMDICHCLWRSAELAGEDKLALRHFKEYEYLRDSLYSKESSLAIARLEARLDFQRQQTADSLHDAAVEHVRETAHRAEMAEEQQRSERILWITVASILLALAAIGAMTVFSRQNRRLRLQNDTIQLQNGLIEKSLVEKDVLLQEVHHRVKNNLQVMTSLLEMQAAQIVDVAAKEAILASKGRVQAMTLIHQKLHQQDDLAQLSFSEYLQQLVDGLREIYPQGHRVEVGYFLEDCQFAIDVAVPLGLIVNELITNAFKYAFVGRDHGRLRLSLRKFGRNRYQMEVEDDGPGMPPDVDWERGGTLGLQLVGGLSRQLKGHIAVERSEEWGGTKVIVTFNNEGR